MEVITVSLKLQEGKGQMEARVPDNGDTDRFGEQQRNMNRKRKRHKWRGTIGEIYFPLLVLMPRRRILYSIWRADMSYSCFQRGEGGLRSEALHTTQAHEVL